MTQPLVSARNLTKVYENGVSVTAVDSISLEVGEGEFLAITGASGSGKSTLLNLLGTLDNPTRGSLVINGKDLAKLRGDALADFRRYNIGFIFQLFHLVPTLTAMENILLPILPYRRGLKFNPDERAHLLVKKLGVDGRANHLPGQLSGGEQQRVAIARALINDPKILLADEPTGNLDSKASHDLMELLKTLNQNLGLTIILVTHDEGLASQADRVLRMADGRIVGT